jgi:hypothetical protein
MIALACEAMMKTWHKAYERSKTNRGMQLSTGTSFRPDASILLEYRQCGRYANPNGVRLTILLRKVCDMRCLPFVLITATLVALAGRICHAGDEAAERRPVPSTADLAKAKKLVKELLGSEIANTKPAGRPALAAKILKQADEAKDDAAGRYVLLCEARDMAAKGGDPLTAARAADDLALEYQVGAGEAREPLAVLATAPMNADSRRTAAHVL